MSEDTAENLHWFYARTAPFKCTKNKWQIFFELHFIIFLLARKHCLKLLLQWGVFYRVYGLIALGKSILEVKFWLKLLIFCLYHVSKLLVLIDDACGWLGHR